MGSFELFVTHHAYVVRYTAFHSVSGFDPALGHGLLDLDLGWRLWLAGYRVRSVGAMPPGVVHQVDDVETATATLLTMLASFLDQSSLGSAWSELGQPGRQASRRRPPLPDPDEPCSAVTASCCRWRMPRCGHGRRRCRAWSPCWT